MSGQILQAAERDGTQSLAKTIDALLVCVREETDALKENLGFDLSVCNARKSRLLYEFARAAIGLGTADMSPELGRQLRGLRKELAANALVVKGHVSAVREISELMISLVRREETDGTYVKPRRGHAAW
jgi:hypothetical protein